VRFPTSMEWPVLNKGPTGIRSFGSAVFGHPSPTIGKMDGTGTQIAYRHRDVVITHLVTVQRLVEVDHEGSEIWLNAAGIIQSRAKR
jgi:hypothetical protein